MMPRIPLKYPPTTMTEPTVIQLERLPTAEREQGLIQLRTLLAQHQQSISRLPMMAAELQAYLLTTDTVHHAALADSMQAALTQANEFLLTLDLVPVDHPDQPELVALGEKLRPLVNSGTVVALSARFARARNDVQQAGKAAAAEQAKADAKAAKQAKLARAVIERRTAAQALGFVDHGDGTVTDTHHRLMWKQCAEGQTGADCAGNPGKFSWEVAMQIPTTLNMRGGFAGHKDWRVPTKDELATLVMHARTSPAICTEAFPNAPSTLTWSSSPLVDTHAWYVYFDDGDVGCHVRSYAYSVRLVRTSQ
jgi:hypothetical protein